MRFESRGIVGEFSHVGAVRMTVAEGDVHDGAGERRVGAGLQDQPHIGLLDRRIVVDVDDDDLGAALLSRLDRVGHDVDLRRHRIGAPDHHAIGLGHLPWVRSAQGTGRHGVAGPGHVGADRPEEAGITLGVAQPLDGVALHLPHGPGIEIGPDRLRAVSLFGLDELVGDLVEGRLPGNLLPTPLALRTDPALRHHQAAGMIDTLRIAGDFGADDPGGVGVFRRAAYAPDPALGGEVDLQRTSRGTVMRTDRMADGLFLSDRGRNVHGFSIWHGQGRSKPHSPFIETIDRGHRQRL